MLRGSSAPIVSGLNKDQFETATTDANEGTVFGNMVVTSKWLLHKSDTWAASIGVAVELPTAPNGTVTLQPVPPPVAPFVISIQDDSVYVEPFVGLLLAPNDHWFSISYVQVDVDANGDRVTTTTPVPSQTTGILRDPTLLYIDTSVGYWLFHDREIGCGLQHYLTGIAPVVELHYTTTLQDYQPVSVFIPPNQRMSRSDSYVGVAIPDGPAIDLGSLGSPSLADDAARQAIRLGSDRRIEPPVLRAACDAAGCHWPAKSASASASRRWIAR